MATCPRCGAFLSDRHQCAPAWRRYLRLALSLSKSAAIGAVVGSVVFIALDGHASLIAIGLSAVIGIVIDLAVHLV